MTKATPPDDSLAPRFLSPRRGKPVRRRDAERLREYAIRNGGRVEMTQATLNELQHHWDVRPTRIAACICNLRQYYGVDFIAERDGRKVTAYVMKDSL